jgi:hypothetical protein
MLENSQWIFSYLDSYADKDHFENEFGLFLGNRVIVES